MATCQVDSAALATCKSSIDAYTAAIAAAQAQAQKDAAAVNARNILITQWEGNYAIQLQKRDEGRLAGSKQVWYKDHLYNCDKLSAGDSQDTVGF